MKALQLIVSGAILAVLLWGFLAYQSNVHQSERERQEQILSDCWANAVANGLGADVCTGLANQLNK